MSKFENDSKTLEKKYFNLINSILDVVVELDLDLIVNYINPQVYDLFGYIPEEIIGENSTDFIHQDDVLNVVETIKKGIKTREIISVSFRIRHKKGYYIHVSAKGRIVEYENQTKIVAVFRDITKEKEAEQKLKVPDERYREIIENIEDGYFELDLQGNFTYVNDYISKYLGIVKEDLIGKNPTSIMNKDTIKEVLEIFNQVYINNLPKGTFISKVIRNDGVQRTFEGTVYLRYNSSGKKIGFYGFTRDMTERIINEEKIRESEKKFRNIFNSIPDLFFLVTEDSTILEYNGKQEELYIPPEQFLGKKMIDVLPKDVSDLFRDVLYNTLNSETPQTIEYSLPLASEIRYFEARHLLFDKKKVAIFIRNITEKKESEKKLKESEEKFRIISEQSLIGISITQDNIVKYVNRPFAESSGYTVDEIMNWKPDEFMKLIYPEDRKILMELQSNNQIDNGELPKPPQYRVVNKFGEVNWVEMISNTIKYEDKDAFLNLFLNITERKKAEQKLKESEEKYREAYNRVELYKDLFYHDINNILSNIKLSIDLSESYLNIPEKYNEIKDLYLLINKQFARGTKLINDVRKLSSIESSEKSLKSIDAMKLLDEAIIFIKTSIQAKNVDIRITSSEKEIKVRASEFLIEIFDNLLINAVNYNDNPKKEVLIKISSESKENTSYIKFEFIDNGIGISDEMKEIIFQEGFNKEKGSKGMGFGLTLVKKILESYNGYIWIEDAVKGDYSQGSNFVFLIPETEK